ncbi:MAG TPA: hypothetical protein VK206_10085 [Anaerolineales bacterium]|nr:hypothetical protein [Anaerolineales bacterium]HLO29779.1 hypothetical protein [Anaerolineales bacterium]
MEKKRPTIITIVCAIGFFGALISIPLIFSDIAKNIGAWYPPLLALSSIVGLITMVGLWSMKKWSVILYTGMFLINQVIMLATGIWNIAALILPGIVVVIMFSQYAKMD